MDALRHIKRILGQRQKVGHGGTMDPLASGVLPICFGQATRLMDHVVDSVKVYQAEITLGITTTTYDAEGEVTKRVDLPDLTEQMIEDGIHPWIGVVDQTPPMYSAIKVNGKRLYKLARAGVDVERRQRSVAIHSINILEFVYPKLVIKVECGKGTYIRSLAHDLGESLGCGGHVSNLVRLFCGTFPIENSVTLRQLEESVESPDPEGWQRHLYPLDRVLMGLKSITVGAESEEQLRHGQAIVSELPISQLKHLEERRVYNSTGAFMALVSFDHITNTWHPTKVFTVNASSSQVSDSK